MYKHAKTEKPFCKMKDVHFCESEIWPLTLWGKMSSR